VKYHDDAPLNNEYTLYKMKYSNVKQVMLVRVDVVNVLYKLVWKYNWNMLELFQVRGMGVRKNDGCVNLTKVHYKHICKCHYEIQL
jgi:hypothetical protein